ncbi:MAG: hypothetical protein ACD_60C00048G0005 [uncultured bacterium]|nr:MAG: hypothetical protein ACD_60C00048G0005 [uncultured bacterium]
MISRSEKIIITGAAGLVGQNLILHLQEKGYQNIIALDKQKDNLQVLKKFNPNITTVHADLAERGQWGNFFENCQIAILLHAQITGLHYENFVKNTITATENVLAAIKYYKVSYTVHVSSSVVNSVAKDFYTISKQRQEEIVLESGISCCVLRPTLMFGWFDPKHLGWLSRFMEKSPLFPIPGHGQYIRQPLYSRDFCRIIIAAIEKKPINKIYDIVGQEKISYVDLIKSIKKAKKLKTLVVKIPYRTFYLLLKCYALISKNPPFTADQLKALTAGDYFSGIDPQEIFGVPMTSLNKAIEETFTHPVYSPIILER